MEQWSGHGYVFSVTGESIKSIEYRLREFVDRFSEQYRFTSGHRPPHKPLISSPESIIFHIADLDGHLLVELILTQLKIGNIHVEFRADLGLDQYIYLRLIACIDPKEWYGPALLSLTEGKPLSPLIAIDGINSTLNHFMPWLARKSISVQGTVPGYDVDFEITPLKGYEARITNLIEVYQELVLRTKQRDLPEWHGRMILYQLEEIAPARIQIEVFYQEISVLPSLFSKVIEQICTTWPEARRRIKSETQKSASETTKTIILFVAPEPSDLPHLRLGEEIREIHEKLQLAELRDKFKLEQRHAIRAVDLTQALLDVKPNIVHFAGHSTPDGSLCLEDVSGLAHAVSPDALGVLLNDFASHVTCVVLTTCHSESQATSIAKHIDYAIGVREDISDKAAVAFSAGFYQALGAGCSIEKAYQLGCNQIALQGMDEQFRPILKMKASQ